MKEDNGYTTVEDYMNGIFGSDGGSQLKAELMDDLDAYSTLGFDGYLNDKVSQGLLSPAFRDYLQAFFSGFSSWFSSVQPDAAALKSYLNEKSLQVESNENLCAYEKYQAKLYHESILGWYLFNAPVMSGVSLNSLEVRGCNWWQVFLCGTAGLITGVLAGTIAGALVLVSEIIVNDEQVGGQAKDDIAVATFLAVTIYVGVEVFLWCCRGFDSGTDCVEPRPELHVFSTDCNEYVIYVPHQSGGSSMYFWENTNLLPETAITENRSLPVEVVNPNLLSSSRVDIYCMDSRGPHEYFSEMVNVDFSQFSDSPPPAPSWLWAPPASAVTNTEYNIAVLIAGYEHYELAWSTLYGVSLTETGPFTAKITFTSTGTISISAIVTNICSGQYAHISAMSNVSN